jgi:hypothetical protein
VSISSPRCDAVGPPAGGLPAPAPKARARLPGSSGRRSP